MSRVHFIGGEKGGVGKSVVARLLAQYWIDRAIPFTAFDTDRSSGALLRCYSAYTTPIDVTQMEQLDQIVGAIEDSVEEVIVDLAAQTEAGLEAWLSAAEVPSLLQRLGHPLWFWFVIDDGKDSIRLLSSFLDRADPSCHIVCIRNQGCGQNFELFREAKLEDRVLQAGGRVIDLPALHAESMRKIDAYDKSFWAAIHNTNPEEAPCLSLMQRERAKVFIRQAHSAFRQILNPSTFIE